jgi:4-hydroxybenzoate polyprenyltransferase/geranylgeranylglycerol-phosphate geranylgeranyltransferase
MRSANRARPWTRTLTRKLLAHLEMTRPYTLFHAGLLGVAGAVVASGGRVAPGRAALAGLVTICGWEAGLYAGDYYDRRLDALSKPYRPIPSGRVSPREAFGTMLALIGAGYAASLALGPANLLLAAGTTALGIAYSKTFKAHALLGNFDRGVLGACAVAFGALAGGDLAAAPVLPLALLAFFHDSATNLVGAVRDVAGDRAAGYRTVPVVYGVARSCRIAAGLAALALLAGGVLLAELRAGPVVLALFAAAALADVRVYGSLLMRAGGPDRAEALGAHKWLIAERLTLLCAVIAAAAPTGVALALLAGTLLASLGAQALLRDRYESARPAEAAPSLGAAGELAPSR